MCLEITSVLRAAVKTRLDIRGRKSIGSSTRNSPNDKTSPASGNRAVLMSPTAADTAVPGSRFALSGYIGTIRFVGEVDGTSGIWLGVEWDDRARGKHDGIKDGKRYFSCL
jgi:hypothetical protein